MVAAARPCPMMDRVVVTDRVVLELSLAAFPVVADEKLKIVEIHSKSVIRTKIRAKIAEAHTAIMGMGVTIVRVRSKIVRMRREIVEI